VADDRPGPPYDPQTSSRPRRPRPQLDVAGLCVLILAASIAITLVLAAIDVSLRGFQLTPEGTDLLSTITGAIIGVIATYIGLRSRGRDD
jgi:hypothetical protein